MKFLKIAAVWFLTLVVMGMIGYLSARFGMAWLVQLTASAVYGVFFSLVFLGLLKLLTNWTLDGSFGVIAGTTLIGSSLVGFSLYFFVGTMIGVGLCYWLILKSKDISGGQEQMA